jgi:hypothetical protein
MIGADHHRAALPKADLVISAPKLSKAFNPVAVPEAKPNRDYEYRQWYQQAGDQTL